MPVPGWNSWAGGYYAHSEDLLEGSLTTPTASCWRRGPSPLSGLALAVIPKLACTDCPANTNGVKLPWRHEYAPVPPSVCPGQLKQHVTGHDSRAEIAHKDLRL